MSRLLLTVDLADLSGPERTVRYAADERDRAEIADRLDLQAVTRFDLNGILRRVRSRGDALFAGQVTADVTQTCVVTLDPVEASVTADIQVRLVKEDAADTGKEVEVDPDDDDVEIIEDDVVDIGDIAVQYLAMSLDPYPRKPGSEAQAARLGLVDAERVPEDPDVSERKNPFAVLKQLKDKA